MIRIPFLNFTRNVKQAYESFKENPAWWCTPVNPCDWGG